MPTSLTIILLLLPTIRLLVVSSFWKKIAGPNPAHQMSHSYGPMLVIAYAETLAQLMWLAWGTAESRWPVTLSLMPCQSFPVFNIYKYDKTGV